jgi:hypothetical protein
MSRRLMTKPGTSCDCTGVLSIFSLSASVVLSVASEVRSPLMISTSFITGTGFMKCIPITSSGRLVTASFCARARAGR